MKKYTKRKEFRLDEKTLNILKRNLEKRNLAVKKKMSESEYIRELIINDNFERLTFGVDKSSYGKIMRILSGLGNNVNQIAHKMNMDIFDKNDIEELRRTREEIIKFRKVVNELIIAVRNGD